VSMARPVRLASKSKYHAQPTVVDGIRFHSKREAQRYGELKLLETHGRIHGLELQPAYPLDVLGLASSKIGTYVADFKYCECLTPHDCMCMALVVEDVKGVKTALYKWKKKHVEAQYGIQIREIR
jgi:hypothetical protein